MFPQTYRMNRRLHIRIQEGDFMVEEGQVAGFRRDGVSQIGHPDMIV